MKVYLDDNFTNFKTLFLKLFIGYFSLEKNRLCEIIYVNKNKDHSLFSKELPCIIPDKLDDRINPIYCNELEIAKALSKLFLPVFLVEEVNKNNEFVEYIINDLKYDIKKTIEKFNLNLEELPKLIRICDLFCYCLLFPELESFELMDIKYKNILKWKKLIEKKLEKTLLNFDLLKAYNQEKKSIEKYQQNNLKNNDDIIFDNKSKDTQNGKKYYIKFIENKCSSGYFIDFNDKIININQKEREFINGDIFYYNIYDEGGLNEKAKLIKYKFYEVDFEEWNINENIPLFIYGKILEKKDDYIVILSHKSKNIIFIDDKENVFNNVKENEFYYFSFLKFIEEKQKTQKFLFKNNKIYSY